MRTRLGKVTNVYPDGRVKVEFEDEKNTSMPLPMLTFNREYTLPAIGDRVVTMHLENGSSKGFILGTYWSGGSLGTKTDEGYRKDFENGEGGAYATVKNGKYELHAVGKATVFINEKESLTLEENKVTVSIAGSPVVIVEAGKVSVNGEIIATGNVSAASGAVTMLTHTHTGVHGETTTGHG